MSLSLNQPTPRLNDLLLRGGDEAGRRRGVVREFQIPRAVHGADQAQSGAQPAQVR